MHVYEAAPGFADDYCRITAIHSVYTYTSPSISTLACKKTLGIVIDVYKSWRRFVLVGVATPYYDSVSQKSIQQKLLISSHQTSLLADSEIWGRDPGTTLERAIIRKVTKWCLSMGRC